MSLGPSTAAVIGDLDKIGFLPLLGSMSDEGG